MHAYIEIVGFELSTRRELSSNDLRNIGKFTRGNVTAWLNSRTTPDWVEFSPARDFHAVCGDTDIPWAAEEAKRVFQRWQK